MFANKTVFILGAGASCHYGYPTGEGLVREVLRQSIYLRDFATGLVQAPNGTPMPSFVIARAGGKTIERYRAEASRLATDCQKLIDRLLAVNPPVIDYFLGRNPELQEVGSLMIAMTILQHESFYEHVQRTPHHREFGEFPKADWVRFLLERIVRDCPTSKSLLNNDVTFVTFNYDISLERRLFRGLSAMSLFKEADIREFMSEGRFLHVYGQIAEDACSPVEILPRSESIGDNTFEQFCGGSHRTAEHWQIALDRAHSAAGNLRTIDPANKGQAEAVLTRAREAIDHAAVIYILGFAFDPNNCARLGLDKYLKEDNLRQPKVVCYTNYMNARSVERATSKLFYGTEYPDPQRAACHRNPLEDFVYEKSTGNCYQALQTDFGAPESSLIAAARI